MLPNVLHDGLGQVLASDQGWNFSSTFPDLWLWASNSTFLGLRFLSWKLEMLTGLRLHTWFTTSFVLLLS